MKTLVLVEHDNASVKDATLAVVTAAGQGIGRYLAFGVGSDVVVPVTLARQGAQTVATGAFPIRRLQFRIGENEWADTAMVADEVQVKFRLVLTGVAPL